MAAEQGIQRADCILEMDGIVEILGPECIGSHPQNKLPICLLRWSSVSSFSNHATCSKCKAIPTILCWKSRILSAVPSTHTVHTFCHFLHTADRWGRVYSWWHHKLPEPPSLSRCQSTWNCSITKLAMIVSKYVDGHSSIYQIKFSPECMQQSLRCPGPNVWNHGDSSWSIL